MADAHGIQEGERAAFHGRPGDGIAPLTAWLSQPSTDDPALALRARWLLGVCQGASGLFGSAAATLEPLLALPESADATHRHYAAQAACALAAIHRQIGRFSEARGFDQWAGQVAVDDPVMAFTSTLGLAADAVGRHDRQLARDYVTRAAQLCSASPPWWRERIRLGWVQAEVALTWDLPGDAVVALQRSVAEAEHLGAPRHVAKGLSFLAVAQYPAGEAQAVATLGRAAMLAELLGAWPLVWVTRGLLADWLRDDPPVAQRHRSSAERAVAFIAADLPPHLLAEWTARPDVAPLVQIRSG